MHLPFRPHGIGVSFPIALLVVALALPQGCGRKQEEARRLDFDWLIPKSGVERERERTVWTPGLLREAARRGVDNRVEHDRTGKSFIWSRGKRSVFELRVVRPGARRLSIEAFPLLSTPGAKQRAELQMNGHRVGSLSWDGPGRRELLLDGESLHPGRNLLELRYSQPRRPRDVLAGSEDERVLALAFQRLELRRADRGPISEPDSKPISKSVSPSVPHPASEPDSQADSSRRMVAGDLWWRWAALPPGSTLELAAQAAEGGAHVELLRDGGSGRWDPLWSADLGAREHLEKKIDLLEDAGRVVRLALAVHRGSLEWRSLRSSTPAPAGLHRVPVVLITLDTTRRDHVGAFVGSDRAGKTLTPHLDAVAAKSVCWSNAYSVAPVTAPTHASVFLSCYPAEHGLRLNGHRLPVIDGSHLGARLRAWGYRSAAFVSLGVLTADLGFDQAFEHFDRHFDQRWWRFAADVNRRLLPWIDAHPQGGGKPPGFLWVHYCDPHKPYGIASERGRGVVLSLDGAVLDTLAAVGLLDERKLRLEAGEHLLQLRVAGAAPPWAPLEAEAPSDSMLFALRALRLRPSGGTRWEPLAGWQERDGFLYMAQRATIRIVVDPSLRSSAPPDSLELRLVVEDVLSADESRRRYAEEITAMDEAFGELWDCLGRNGWLDDGIVAVLADHGEDLGEHGHFGHVEHVGPTLSRIPFLLYDVRLDPRWIEEPVSVIDLAPTLLARLGLAPSPRWRGLDALGLDAASSSAVSATTVSSSEASATAVPSLTTPTSSARPPILLESFPPEAKRHWRGVIWKNWRMEGIVEKTGQPSILRLFDVGADPDCEHDLLATPDAPDPAVVNWLHRQWSQWSTNSATVDATMDPRMLERLKALGYLN